MAWYDGSKLGKIDSRNIVNEYKMLDRTYYTLNEEWFNLDYQIIKGCSSLYSIIDQFKKEFGVTPLGTNSVLLRQTESILVQCVYDHNRQVRYEPWLCDFQGEVDRESLREELYFRQLCGIPISTERCFIVREDPNKPYELPKALGYRIRDPVQNRSFQLTSVLEKETFEDSSEFPQMLHDWTFKGSDNNNETINELCTKLEQIIKRIDNNQLWYYNAIKERLITLSMMFK